MILNIVHELAGHLSQLCGRHILTHRMHVGQSRGHISRRKLIVRFIGVTEMGEAQRSLRAMRTKARDGFIRALGNARRWLDELLIDPAQTIEFARLARRQERALDSDDGVARVHLPHPGGSRTGGSPSTRVQRQAPDRPASSLVRAMARSGTARADPNSSGTRLIHAVFDSLLTLCSGTRCFGPTASIVQPGKRNFAGRDWPVKFGADHRRTTRIRFADALRLANLPVLRGFLSPEKPGRFALTSWWWTQSRETGLRWAISLLAGKEQGIFCVSGSSLDFYRS